MTGLPKRMKYRGVEFDIHQIAEKQWNWHIYPRMQIKAFTSLTLSAGTKTQPLLNVTR